MFLGPSISKKNPINANIIAIKLNNIVIRIIFTMVVFIQAYSKNTETVLINIDIIVSFTCCVYRFICVTKPEKLSHCQIWYANIARYNKPI